MLPSRSRFHLSRPFASSYNAFAGNPLYSIQVILRNGPCLSNISEAAMIRKLKSGEYRIYSKKKDPKTGKRRNLGTFKTKEAAQKHEREIQYFKRH
jgi:hypothetical protein